MHNEPPFFNVRVTYTGRPLVTRFYDSCCGLRFSTLLHTNRETYLTIYEIKTYTLEREGGSNPVERFLARMGIEGILDSHTKFIPDR